MSKRFSETDKWDDVWFRQLSPAAKLAFIFMCDRCDMAGFYELDVEDMAFRTKMPELDILGAVQGLNRGLIQHGKVVWLRNFLRHQKNLPLNPENNAHKHIIYRIDQRLAEFPEVPEILGANVGLFSPIGIGRGKGRGTGKVSSPTRKGQKVTENTPAMIRIGAWFGRRASTLWSVEEARSLTDVGEMAADEVDLLERFYRARIPADKDTRRHSLDTMLNNWNGEVDKARKHFAVRQHSSNPTNI